MTEFPKTREDYQKEFNSLVELENKYEAAGLLTQDKQNELLERARKLALEVFKAGD